eukprot:15325951-Ditylum_brightwellii.AAC.1
MGREEDGAVIVPILDSCMMIVASSFFSLLVFVAESSLEDNVGKDDDVFWVFGKIEFECGMMKHLHSFNIDIVVIVHKKEAAIVVVDVFIAALLGWFCVFRDEESKAR